ncbi:hypothetical protein CFOL_v3_02182 [Cephalotus follicularis]|uniref:Uncharacterized protein n=1 Tax=Cephalotus follicularis TaxID=3775 RepID=A0A1Q3ASF5_CEPFO|nr:hypothetical protein CFOL_v3_02182 [Cephalotus follicularis]
MATTLDGGSSTTPQFSAEKPLIVRVKRKTFHSRLDGFWLEINERPAKRPLLDFEKLSISDSAGKEEWKPKKVFVQHVESVTSSETKTEIVQSFIPHSADASESKIKHDERRKTLTKDIKQLKQDQLLSKSRQTQKILAESARFKQIWRSRKESKDGTQDKELHELCHFYEVVRVDVEKRSSNVQMQEELSLEEQRILSRYMPLMREFMPSAAAEIESDIRDYISGQDDYVYDYYTVKDGMIVDDEDASIPFPLVQVEDEDFYDGPDESEYDSEDSNGTINITHFFTFLQNSKF